MGDMEILSASILIGVLCAAGRALPLTTAHVGVASGTPDFRSYFGAGPGGIIECIHQEIRDCSPILTHWSAAANGDSSRGLIRVL